jgi:hypothetical protein
MFGSKIGIEIEDHIKVKSFKQILQAGKILIRRISDTPEQRKMFVNIRIHANQRRCASLVYIADLDIRKGIFYRADKRLTDHGIADIDIRDDQNFFQTADLEELFRVFLFQKSIELFAQGKALENAVYYGT